VIIAVNNNKGGVLKTTTVTNLAGVLHEYQKKVLIIDTDNQSNVALSFGHNPDNYRTTLYDVLIGGVPPEDAIQKVTKYIDYLPSNTDLVSFEWDVIGNTEQYDEPFTILKDKLEHLREQYDYILIDTPPSLSLMIGNVFTFADRVLIPFEPETYAMRSLVAVVKTVKEFQEEYNPDIKIAGILPTKVVHNSTLHRDILQSTRKFGFENDIPVYEAMVPRTVQYANSVGYNLIPITILKNRYHENAMPFYNAWDELTKFEGKF
jgi:chromosome partitioning protein